MTQAECKMRNGDFFSGKVVDNRISEGCLRTRIEDEHANIRGKFKNGVPFGYVEIDKQNY